MATSRKEIGNRLRQVRGELTQQEFADKLGLSRSYLSDVERGRSHPSIAFLQSLAVNFDVSLHWLLTGEDVGINKNHSFVREDADMGRFLHILDKVKELYTEIDSEKQAWLRVELARLTRELQERNVANPIIE
jgi:transcriptional regulator with XRE-family HTH domain